MGTRSLTEYHDSEWGVPVRDDRKLFEFLILEGAQAGLSWLTILKRREAYRSAFCGFRAGERWRGSMREKWSACWRTPGLFGTG